VYRVENGGDVALIAPALTTADAKSHIDILKQIIEETTQLPNLSMENIKGLGAQSGEARKTLLTDAHLKVGEEAHDIGWFLDREFSVIKSLVVADHPEWKAYEHSTMAKHIISPFIQNDEASDIANYSKAAGVLISNKTAIKRAGLSDDADREYEEIVEEKRQEAETNRIENLFTGAM